MTREDAKELLTRARQELQSKWLKEYCPKCANNDAKGTEYCNCQAEYEVEKDTKIACIHYKEYLRVGLNYETDTEVRLSVTNRKKEKVILWDAFGKVEYYPIEALSADVEIPIDETVVHIETYRRLYEKYVDLKNNAVKVVKCKNCRYRFYDKYNDCYSCDRHEYGESFEDDDYCSWGELAEQTEYKLPGHDEVMEALDKMTLRGDKDE